MVFDSLFFYTLPNWRVVRFAFGFSLLSFIFNVILDLDIFLSIVIAFVLMVIFDQVWQYKIMTRGEREIENEKTQAEEESKLKIDKFLDKTKCMSCMASLEEATEFCPECGFKLIK